VIRAGLDSIVIEVPGNNGQNAASAKEAPPRS
jgi:hypothetical protein